jgi:hypothetical protein
MAPEASPYFGFEWDSTFYCFDVLPFGLYKAQWLFITVMGHLVRFLLFQGNNLMGYLDNLIIASGSARGAIESAQQMIHILSDSEFAGWLIHPTKCVGTSEAANTFTALGTFVDLSTQTYAVPPATIGSILSSIATLLTGSPSRGVAVRAVARLKGLVASTWLATGPATRVHTRAIDGVIASRAGTLSRREKRAPGERNGPVGTLR